MPLFGQIPGFPGVEPVFEEKKLIVEMLDGV